MNTLERISETGRRDIWSDNNRIDAIIKGRETYSGYSPETDAPEPVRYETLSLSDEALAMMAGKKLSAFNEKPQQQTLIKPVNYKENKQIKTTNFKEILNKSSEDLGKIWSNLSNSKFEIYDELTDIQKNSIEKKLMEYAYSQAQNQFNNKDTSTFNNFGENLNQIPEIHAKNDKEKSETLYKHYLGFLDKNNTKFPLWQNILEVFQRGNSVAAIKDGHGRCGEHSKSLRDMFNGAQVPSETVETWSCVEKDKNGIYKKDVNGMKGFGANHQSVMVLNDDEKGNSQESIFDPAKYFLEKTKKRKKEDWNHSVTWPKWVEYHHKNGWYGPLNTFIQGEKVIKDFNDK